MNATSKPTPSSGLTPSAASRCSNDGPAPRFAATRWSLVLAAGDWRAGSAAWRAMGELAKTYWFPLYAYLRRLGCRPHDAEDLVQGFFARLLEKDGLASANQSKGTFRGFLLASLRHFQANEWDRRQAAKRGGGREIVALDALDAEARYALEPHDNVTPERLFERRWALAVLERVLARLREEYAARGQDDVCAALEPVLVEPRGSGYARIAAELKMTEAAVKVAAHRLRRRYRECLREEIGQTVAEPALVDDEIRHLLASL